MEDRKLKPDYGNVVDTRNAIISIYESQHDPSGIARITYIDDRRDPTQVCSLRINTRMAEEIRKLLKKFIDHNKIK